MMKNFLTLILAAFTISASAQIEIEEKTVNIDGNKDGFFIVIPYGDKKMIEKELKDELKSWKGKYSEKNYVFVDDCKLKSVGDNTFDVYAKVEEYKDGGATVSIAIDLGGAMATSKDHPKEVKAIYEELYGFAVGAAKNVVDGEIKEEEKALKEREKELEDLEKDQKKLEKEIEDYQKKIEDNKKAIEESKKQQGTKKEEITEQEKKLKAAKAKKEAVK